MSKIKVNCRYDKMINIANIKRNPHNPNKHSTEQITRLAIVIERNGWRNPLVVSKRSGYLVKGECRLLAAFRLNCEVVPVEFQDYESDEAEYSDLIADNKIAELSEQDNREILGILDDLQKNGSTDLLATGFSSGEINSLLSMLPKPQPIVADTPAMEVPPMKVPTTETPIPMQTVTTVTTPIIQKESYMTDFSGYDECIRPEVKETVQDLGEVRNNCYFYIEYYKEPELFEALKEKLKDKDVMLGANKISSSFFANLIKGV